MQKGLLIADVMASVCQSGIRLMSHLSILPTVFTRLDWLEQSLRDEGFTVHRDASLPIFGATQRVDLLASMASTHPIAWLRRPDGTIEMCGDLQRITLHAGLNRLLQRVSRRYSLLEAMDQIQQLDSFDAEVSLTTA